MVRALDALDRPATRDDIGAQVLMLMLAFPNVSSRDLKPFGKMLTEDVTAAAPGRLALEWACRKLRRMSRFVPTIAETLEALALATQQNPRHAREDRLHAPAHRRAAPESKCEDRISPLVARARAPQDRGSAQMSDRFTRDKLTWLDQVFRDRAITNLGFKIAYAIASHVNRKTLEAWPTHETLENETGASRSSIIRAIAELERAGHLAVTRVHGRHRVNRYRWIVKNRNDEEPQFEFGEESAETENVSAVTPFRTQENVSAVTPLNGGKGVADDTLGTHEKVSPVTRKGVTSDQKRCHPRHTEHFEEHFEEHVEARDGQKRGRRAKKVRTKSRPIWRSTISTSPMPKSSVGARTERERNSESSSVTTTKRKSSASIGTGNGAIGWTVGWPSTRAIASVAADRAVTVACARSLRASPRP